MGTIEFHKNTKKTIFVSVRFEKQLSLCVSNDIEAETKHRKIKHLKTIRKKAKLQHSDQNDVVAVSEVNFIFIHLFVVALTLTTAIQYFTHTHTHTKHKCIPHLL